MDPMGVGPMAMARKRGALFGTLSVGPSIGTSMGPSVGAFEGASVGPSIGPMVDSSVGVNPVEPVGTLY